MGFIEIIILSLGLAMDATAVGMTDGLSNRKIKLSKALLIGLVFGFFQAMMPLLGFLFGNLFALMPYGMFIPLMFNKINKYYKFLIMMIILVIVIELLQFITLSGSCDIDDLILNVMGASIIYFICKIKGVRKIINKIFLFE